MCKIRNNIFDELYLSFKECYKNKPNSLNAINFLINKEKNLISLKYELENKIYIPGKSICFIIEKPKIREVFAADFRDRVIHHFFIRAIEKKFYNNLTNAPYSCIKGKGIHNCIANIKKIKNKYKYYLQIDIKSFFMSIDKNILKQKIKKYLPKNNLEHINNNINFSLDIYEYLFNIIVDFNPTSNFYYKGDLKLKEKLAKEKSLFYLQKGKGLAIGNYSSQFFANIYLNDLDKFILSLGYKDYFRYVDDLLIFGNDFKKLKDLENIVNNYLKDNLLMQLADGKTKLKQINHGIDFLGYFIKPYSIYVRKRVIHNFIGKLNILKKDLISYFNLKIFDILFEIDSKNNYIKIISFKEEKLNNLFNIIASYIGHLSHANAKHLLKKIIYKNSFLRYYISFDGKKLKYLKQKKFKNINKAYNFYDKLYKNIITPSLRLNGRLGWDNNYKNTIIFFPLNNYYIFKKKYLKLLKDIPIKYYKYIIKYKNIGFKIHKKYYKILILAFLEKKEYNILIINKNINKYSLEKLFII